MHPALNITIFKDIFIKQSRWNQDVHTKITGLTFASQMCWSLRLDWNGALPKLIKFISNWHFQQCRMYRIDDLKTTPTYDFRYVICFCSFVSFSDQFWFTKCVFFLYDFPWFWLPDFSSLLSFSWSWLLYSFLVFFKGI